MMVTTLIGILVEAPSPTPIMGSRYVSTYIHLEFNTIETFFFPQHRMQPLYNNYIKLYSYKLYNNKTIL